MARTLGDGFLTASPASKREGGRLARCRSRACAVGKAASACKLSALSRISELIISKQVIFRDYFPEHRMYAVVNTQVSESSFRAARLPGQAIFPEASCRSYFPNRPISESRPRHFRICTSESPYFRIEASAFPNLYFRIALFPNRGLAISESVFPNREGPV